MTQQEFNTQVIAIANRITGVFEYSYTRQGFKYNPHDPTRFLDNDERAIVEILKAELNNLMTTFLTK